MGLFSLWDAIDEGGDVSRRHGPAIAISDDQRAVALAGNELIVCADGVSLVKAVKGALSLIDVGLTERDPQIFETEAVRGQRRWIGLNAHCRTLAATDTDETNSAQLRNFLIADPASELFTF